MREPSQQPYLVVLPRTDNAAANFKEGSAIVAEEGKDLYLLHYEGNVYDACNLKTFAGKLICAAGRKATKYPTTALLGVPKETFEQDYLIAGEFDYPQCQELLRKRRESYMSDEDCVAQTCRIEPEMADAFQAWTREPAPSNEPAYAPTR
jgi:hypothetical protein